MKYFYRNSKEQYINKEGFVYFDNLDEYIRLSEREPVNLIENIKVNRKYQNQIKTKYSDKFYDYAKSYEELIASTKLFRHFKQYEAERKEFYEMLKAEGIVNFELKSSHAKTKGLDFNDLGLGVFCFSRAAMQLRKTALPNGNTKIVSDVRKVYGYFPKKKEGIGIVVRIMLPVRFSKTFSQKELFYNSFACFVVIEYLIEQGIDIEIYLRRTVKTPMNYGQTIVSSRTTFDYITSIIKLFDSKESEWNFTVKNNILLAVAESRFYRTIHLLSSTNTADIVGVKMSIELGYAVSYSDQVRSAENIIFNGENMIYANPAHSYLEAKKQLIDILDHVKKLKENPSGDSKTKYRDSSFVRTLSF